MTKVRTWAGLDVHAAATVACVVDAPSGEMSVQRLPGRTSEVAAFCARLPGSGPRAPTRRGRPGSSWRARWTGPGSAAWSRRRGRSSVPRRIGSRPTGATPSGSCGC